MATHDLTVGSIRKHLANIAIPSMTGSIFMTLYNVVDSIWAGRVGVNVEEIFSAHKGNVIRGVLAFLGSSGDSRALSALSVSFPIFLIILALSIGVMGGTLALIGNALGKKNQSEATGYLVQAFLYALATSLVMFLIIPLFPLIMNLMQVQDMVVREYAKDYLYTIVYGGVFFSASMVANAGLISRGDSKTQRNVSIATFFLNIILDPLFMLGFGPIPAMGISGIALATIFSQGLGFAVYMYKLHSYKAFEGLTPALWKPNPNIIGQIAKQSLPQTINIAIVAFLLGTVNSYAIRFEGAAAAAAYGICLRIEQIALIPSMGISTAISSIGSQNNGAKIIARVREVYRTGIFIGVFLWLGLMIPLTMIFPKQIIKVFTQDPDVVRIGLAYLQVCFFTFYAYLLFNFTGAVFQSIKKPYWTTIFTVCRNCIFPFITFPLLAAKFGLDGVWYGILINNWIAAAALVIIYFVLIKKREYEANEEIRIEADTPSVINTV